MTIILAVAGLTLLASVAAIQIISLFRRTRVNLEPLQRALESIERSYDRIERSVREEIARNRQETGNVSRQSREELTIALKSVGDTMHRQLVSLTQTNELKLERMRETVEEKLKTIQEDNGKQLDRMRATVEEQLQGTLEKRLGESFRQVSERLEQVYKGLGEMQTLATGVGDLKKVLTNVKTRGVFGEVQLWAMLEEILTPEQYEKNVATKESGERVDFAVRLPGRYDVRDDIVWLPIDAKFPTEDYLRLVEAQEKSDAESAEMAARQLEARIKQCAGDICSKYINPPKTTDFGILFLPTEGLFAEVIRRTGLTELVQRECKVLIAGPSNLWAFLNSLQMGFRTLAIQKRSSEVWNLLAAVKTEWTKYGEVLGKVQKKLLEASETIEKAQTRTRAIGRKLRDVQELPVDQAQDTLMLDGGIENDNDEAEETEGPALS